MQSKSEWSFSTTDQLSAHWRLMGENLQWSVKVKKLSTTISLYFPFLGGHCRSLSFVSEAIALILYVFYLGISITVCLCDIYIVEFCALYVLWFVSWVNAADVLHSRRSSWPLVILQSYRLDSWMWQNKIETLLAAIGTFNSNMLSYTKVCQSSKCWHE